MFKRPTKKQRLIQRIILSVIATTAVLIIATSAILFMLGYRLDSGNGKLEQGALLQFDSRPNDADVWIDGRMTGSRTATKKTVVAGTHAFLITKNGYEDWARTIDLKAGTLTWLDYIRMVPKDRTPESVTSFESLVALKASPDLRFILAQEKADDPTFQLIDIRDMEPKTSEIALPDSLYSEANTPNVAHAFAIHEWNTGGRYVLMTHTYGATKEWLMVDTENVEQSINVSQLLSVGFKDLHFAGTNGRTLYGLADDGVIRKLDLSSATLSRGLVTHVEQFNVHEANILSYIGVDPAENTKKVAGVYRDGDEASHILRRTDSPDIALEISVGRYFGEDYVAIAEGNEVTILKGSYPTSSSHDSDSLKEFALFELTAAVQQLSFSPESDYVLAQANNEFKSYELEHRRTAGGNITTAENTPATSLRWLDKAHLWNDDANSLVMRDFDGNNAYTIMPVTTGYDASLSQNGRFFYGVNTVNGGIRLQRVEMILN